jgi:hypothetical protein
VRACRCDEDGRCTSQALSEGSDLKICLVVRSSEGDSIEIKDSRLEQESFTIALIEDNVDVAQDVSHQCSNGSCNVRISVSSALYGDDRPRHLVVAGSVVVVAGGARRNLRALNSQNRQIVEFSTTVLLKNAIAKQSEGDNDAGGMPKLWWLLLLLLLVVIAVIAWYIRRRIQKVREGTLNQL